MSCALPHVVDISAQSDDDAALRCGHRDAEECGDGVLQRFTVYFVLPKLLGVVESGWAHSKCFEQAGIQTEL